MLKIEALIWVSFWRALKFQLFSWRAGSNPRRQSKNIEMKHKAHIKLAHELYVVHVSSTMWRIKNRPSNSTSCSDNALRRLLVLVAGSRLYRGLQVTSSFCNLGLRFEGLVWESRGIFWRPKSCLKGIEDFKISNTVSLRSLLLLQERCGAAVDML